MFHGRNGRRKRKIDEMEKAAARIFMATMEVDVGFGGDER